jgi:hypothetical protein
MFALGVSDASAEADREKIIKAADMYVESMRGLEIL